MSDCLQPMDCNLPGPSIHGILQAKILEWFAMPSSRGSSQPRDPTQVSHIAGGAKAQTQTILSEPKSIALSLTSSLSRMGKILYAPMNWMNPA